MKIGFIGTGEISKAVILGLLKSKIKYSKIMLNIQVIGYEQKLVEVSLANEKNNLGKLFLKTKSIELTSVHIHSDINETNQISDIQISGIELGENLKGNIATTLSNQPNIGINSFGIVTSKPSLRGFSGDRFLLTKDGDETGDLSQYSSGRWFTSANKEITFGDACF